MYLSALSITIAFTTAYLWLYNPVDPPPQLDPIPFEKKDTADVESIGSIKTLTLDERSTLNIEHSGDFIICTPGFFHPDLVTDGRIVTLSSAGFGGDGTRLLWQGRPWRNLRNGVAGFQLIPPLFVGGVRSVTVGSLSGCTAAGGVVEFSPASLQPLNPETYLHHRDGYYGFAPVEFVHARRVGSKTHLTFSGFFPSSAGRFENSRHTGHTLNVDIERKFSESSKLRLIYMDGVNRNGIPFSNLKRTVKRSDLDLVYDLELGNEYKIELGGYRVDQIERITDYRNYGYDNGLRLKLTSMSVGLNLSFSELGLNQPESEHSRLSEFEGNVVIKREFGRINTSFMAGGYGWLPKRVRPTFTLGVDTDLSHIGSIYAVLQQAVEPHSPEMMSARYYGERPYDDLQAVWRAHPDMPITGQDLPVTISRKAQVGWRKQYGASSLEFSTFTRSDINAVYWAVEGDTLVTPRTVSERITVGIMSTCGIDVEPFRGVLNAMVFDRDQEILNNLPAVLAEPKFRFTWEVGWHNSFWDNDFEADISLSGKYYSEFDSYGPNGWERIGGAYPLDFRLTARIRRFTLYWGLHNWNSYQYYLVPGYRMMHKEEYWGVYWLLFD